MLKFIFIALSVLFLLAATIIVVKRKFHWLPTVIFAILFYILGYIGPEILRLIHTDEAGSLIRYPKGGTIEDLIVIIFQIAPYLLILCFICKIIVFAIHKLKIPK